MEKSENTGEETKVTCCECGKSFSTEDIIVLEGSSVCGACTPMFVQKMKEGAALPGKRRYAGFWVRAGADFLDCIVLLIAYFIVGMLLPPNAQTGKTFIRIAVAASYTIWFLGTHSATPGKMASGLEVIVPGEEKITYGRACGRFFSEYLSLFTLCIGYIMAVFDEEKRTLHDRICKTRVVQARVKSSVKGDVLK